MVKCDHCHTKKATTTLDGNRYRFNELYYVCDYCSCTFAVRWMIDVNKYGYTGEHYV